MWRVLGLVIALLTACGANVPGGAAPSTPAASASNTPAPAEPPKTRQIPLAITLDDLPFIGPTRPGDSRARAIERTLAALRAHRAPAAAFVTCDRIQSDAELRAFAESDLVTLGNHSTAHRALDDLGIDGWRDDLVACQRRIERITGRAPVHFRYPFLRTGRELSLRDAGFRTLRELGLRRVPVSIDTSDWQLAAPCVEALRAGDIALAQRIADAYVEHVLRAARRYVRLAERAGHANAAQILLLHGNALTADHLGRLLGALEREGFSFVPIEDALRDRLYAERDHYTGPIGLSWLHRIRGADPRAWAWDAAQTHALAVRFVREKERARFDLDPELSIRALSPNTWIVVDREPWPANSLVAQMPDGKLLLVDTPYTDDATRVLLDWIGARFGSAPIVALNTHFHPDAVGGNRALAAAGARILGSEHTARLVTERARAIRDQLVAALADRPELAARFTHYDPLPPSERFDPGAGLQLSFGIETVRVVHPGAAHSPDNVVVHFPKRSLVFGGCMIGAREQIGNVVDADLRAWPAAVERVRALGATIVVPGHGDRTDAGLLDHTLELVRAASK